MVIVDSCVTVGVGNCNFGLQQGWSDSNLTDDAVVARASAAAGSLFAADLWET